ncbi:MAG: DUF3093 domain-containing protein [Streptosporangiaceae bacterium]
MHSYSERLRVPTSYWGLGFITMVTFATFAWAGFSLVVAAASYLVLLGVPGVALWLWGNASVVVTDGELRAGREAIPVARAGHVQALDKEQTVKLRGPLADPAAFMLIRPYLDRAVYIEIPEVPGAAAAGSGCPYWLVGTRNPEALAAAIAASRSQARTGDATVA